MNAETVVTALIVTFVLSLIFHIYLYNKKRASLRRYASMKRLQKLSWQEFEELCMRFFEKEGWRVHRQDKDGADGGIDLWMSKGRKRALVQCKHYKDAKVSMATVREIYGLLRLHEADLAYVVTTSSFSKEALRFCKDKPIEPIDGQTLIAMLQRL